MNIALPAALEGRLPPPSSILHDRIVLGMPHLSLGGLSETWLLKELGHRHWQLLARSAGRAVPDFRDAEGRPVYAAFGALTIAEADFGSLREHDELSLTSELARISRTQFASRHAIACRGRAIGTVELSSVFVRRGEEGRNRSIARVGLDFFPPAQAKPGFGGAAALAARLRGAGWATHAGFRREEGAPSRRHVVNPCPSQDFNGADFLYFASFQAFVDRAEWEWFGAGGLPPALVARDIVFHGNVEIGDRVRVDLMAHRLDGRAVAHWCRLHREIDGALLADVFTRRGAGGVDQAG
ncbi:Pnap_2097 family protein [Ancylobacter terrae]|uniref:Pnap_2097 family protein n=1 Tax=Ancylobacter sp. sgz301288 TaxID=3342077 RepID=UPI003857FC9A